MSTSKTSHSRHTALTELLAALGGDAHIEALVRALASELPVPGQNAIALATTLLDRIGPMQAGWESPRVQQTRRALRQIAAPQTDGPSAQVPALLRQRVPLALAFGGQGAPYLDELAALTRQSAAAAHLVATVVARLRALLADLPKTERLHYPHGLDIATWLQDPSLRPPAAYLARSNVSQPLIFACQVANLLHLIERGYDRPAFRESVVAAAGHSQGVLAAVFAAETWRLQDPTPRAADYADYLFWQGFHMNRVAEDIAPSPRAVASAHAAGLGTPTPMAAVAGFALDTLRAAIGALDLPITIALHNTPTRFIVSGRADALESLRQDLGARAADLKRARQAGRHAGRLPALAWEFLPVSAPFHTAAMAPALAEMRRGLTLQVDPKDLAFPILDTHTAEPIGADLMERLLSMQFLESVHWPETAQNLVVAHGARAILAFGPGDGVTRLTAANLRGHGVPILPCATAAGHEAALDADTIPAPRVPSTARWLPKKTPSGGLDTAFVRFAGMPPFILPGMTPTTADTPIVAAAANAGYAAELAGGGQVTEPILRARLDELRQRLRPGVGIIFNALYLDPYLWALHLGGPNPLIVRLRDEGYPIIGVTVSAGIPPKDEAVALLDRLADAGIWLNAFKPGSQSQIREVLAIADAAPRHTLVVQIEGGRAGGHHSWEPLSDLLRESYFRIRARKNVILAVGGGIGTPAQATALLNGTWAQTAPGHAPLPVDAVFMGTLFMAAKEAQTSPAVKAALVAAPGTTAPILDGDLQGGVTSGRSGLDAPIYYLQNAAARCAALLDTLAGDKDAIATHKGAIIRALDATAKPYFGDAAAMTWPALLRRFAALCAPKDSPLRVDGAWLDPSYRARFEALYRRAEQRLASRAMPSPVQRAADLDTPERAIEAIEALAAAPQPMGQADAAFFVSVCAQRGKPVPFVAIIDANIRRAFKSDSLWASHDPRFDADQVLVIPGPDALAAITRSDEPTAAILERFLAHATENAPLSPIEPPQPKPRSAIDPVTGRFFAAPAARRFQSGPAASPCLDLALRTQDGLLLWDRARYLQNQRAFYAQLIDRDTPFSMTAYRVATLDDTRGAPLAAAFSLAWEPIFDALTETPIDLLRLVHESNAIEAGPAWPPSPERSIQGRARRTALTPLPGGLRIEIEATLNTDRGLLAKLTSRFFIRGDRSQPHTWQRRETGWDLQVETPAQVEFLTDQAWLTLDTPLQSGDRLRLDATVEQTGNALGVDGTLSRDNQRIGRVQLDRPATDSPRAEANPVEVVATLLATPATEIPLDTPRLLGQKRLTAPPDMHAFATASGDTNPIHTDSALARFAGLDRPIVQGMWTAAAATHRAVRVAAGGDASRVQSVDIDFTDVVYPGEALHCDITLVAMARGSRVVSVTVRAERAGEPVVLSGTLRLAPPKTAYAFPGQGIQTVGMGQEALGRSAAARRIWERAEAICIAELGFSLLHVVQQNPTTLRIGDQRLVHPQGVLHLTQLTQVAMVVMAKAQVAELRERGLLCPDALFCGHSVGEYAAIAAVAELLPLSAVVRVVYERGLTMDTLVRRDAQGRSEFAMGVIRPHLAGLDEPGALALVAEIRAQFPDLGLEVVNFNVRGRQYSVTGHRQALDALARRVEARAEGRPAWIWVPGIDVPFHSTLLRDGVDRFRRTLEAVFPQPIAWQRLVGRYVPNLVARPFELTPEFAQAIVDASGSARAQALIDHWPADPAEAARILTIELLAYQFASPVRWIETQDYLLAHAASFVEIGLKHQPTVANMMRSTLRNAGGASALEVLNSDADFERLYGPTEPVELDAAPASATEPAAIPTEAPEGSSAGPVAPHPQVSAPSTGQTLPEVAISAGDGVRSLCALHARVRLDQLQDTETAEELLGGNSARRNQLLADLGAELGISIDGAHELPLQVLAQEATRRASAYGGHGAYLQAAIDGALARGLGAARLDRRRASAYLADDWGLSPGHIYKVLNRAALHARSGDSTRGGALSEVPPSQIASAADGHAWLDTVVVHYAQELGVTGFGRPSAGGGATAASVDASALTALEERLAARLDAAGQALADRPKPGQPLPVEAPDTRGERLALYENEHGDGYEALITPRFEPKRHVALVAIRAWRRRDRAVAALLGETAPASPRGDLNFQGRTALVTGAGPGSIALALCQTLLAGGARVIVTTSRYSTARIQTYKRLYQTWAGDGAELHVVPFNQGSFQDVDALARWVAPFEPDLLVPFAAIGEVADLSGMGGRSLAVLRIMLLGVERLIARLAADNPCHVVLPLSPNHGIFGGDGAYGEAKAGLETLLNKWHHEAWGQHTTLVGAEIGWVRGTGLMAHNDDVAMALEGIQTFSTGEMARLLAAQCTDQARAAALAGPIRVDLTGGLGTAPDLAQKTARARRQQQETRRHAQERARLDAALAERVEAKTAPAVEIQPAPAPKVQAPIPTAAELAALPALDHLDPAHLVAVVGYGEVGPWGSHRTRWAAEKDLTLSLEAVAELAWTMGLIRPDERGGWVDVATDQGIEDPTTIGERYEAQVLDGVGIRVLEPELQGFDPRQAMSWADVHLDQDFNIPVRSREEAEALRAADPEHTEVFEASDGALCVVRRAGTVLKVQKALRLDRFVAGQLPRGWDARRYGLSGERIEQVDRATLFMLIATAEAFLQAGLEPAEIYRFLHPARVACTASSGIGGMEKLARLYRDFELDGERQGDALQETLINVIAGWVVQSYVGSYGAMSLPVGACATAAVSVAEGAALVERGVADMVVCGGSDDLGKEGLVGFMDMNATASADEMIARGMTPRDLSRPNDRRRLGFVEAQGSGIQILCRASIAIDAGLPCYGLVAYADSFGDGLSRSIPAPGLGPAAAAMEAGDRWIHDPAGACDLAGRRAKIAEVTARRAELSALLGAEEAERLITETRRSLGHDFWRGQADTAPLRGALAVFGLGPDDVALVSKHDTSTGANDPNEARIHEAIFEKLGRDPTRPALVISQKSLTGHSKGAAAAWQLAGLLQAMADGVIPGNRNLEDVDDVMADLTHLAFSDVPVTVPRGAIKAAVITSLGFGHVSGLMMVVHPFMLWRALSPATRARWEARQAARLSTATERLRSVLGGFEPLVVLRTERPFVGTPGSDRHRQHELSVLMDADARLVEGEPIYASGLDSGIRSDRKGINTDRSAQSAQSTQSTSSGVLGAQR